MVMRPLARKDELVIEHLPDELVVYDQTCTAAHCLNRSVKWIWEHCDGSRTIDDIANEFENAFPEGDARAMVLSGLDQLAAANLITGMDYEPAARSEKMTRRAALVLGVSAVPIVTSIVVPTSAAAQSRGPGGPPFQPRFDPGPPAGRGPKKEKKKRAKK